MRRSCQTNAAAATSASGSSTGPCGDDLGRRVGGGERPDQAAERHDDQHRPDDVDLGGQPAGSPRSGSTAPAGCARLRTTSAGAGHHDHEHQRRRQRHRRDDRHVEQAERDVLDQGRRRGELQRQRDEGQRGEGQARPGRDAGAGRRAAIPDGQPEPEQRLSQKIARQSATASTAAPASGPRTAPASCTAPTTPSGSDRRSGGQRSATSASVAGTSPPAPMPCSPRPRTAAPSETAVAVSSEPSANSSRQPTSTGTRPRRSASRPSSGSVAV